MTKVSIARDSAGGVLSIEAHGHAGYAQEGEDIVCAAVSALVQTAAIALEKLGGGANIVQEPVRAKVFIKDGMDRGARRDGQVILAAVADGLIAIRDQYSDYLTIREV